MGFETMNHHKEVRDLCYNIPMKLPFTKLKPLKLSAGKEIYCFSECTVKEKNLSTFVKIHRVNAQHRVSPNGNYGL